jgi:hypothetical protein
MIESAVDPFRDTLPPETQAVCPGEALDWPRIEDYLRKNLSSDLDINGEFEVL